MIRRFTIKRVRNATFRRSIGLRKTFLRNRSLPSVVIGGAQKAGTTFLFDILVQQDDYSGPPTKEIHFFSSEWYRGSEWYSGHFGSTNSGKRQIEGSASYLFHPAAAARFAKTLPEARVIFVLRDPVARAYSHYHHNFRWTNRENLSFLEALKAEGDRLAPDRAALTADPTAPVRAFYQFSYAERGKYAQQVARWYNALGFEQVLLVDSMRLFEGDKQELAQISSFLGSEIDWSTTRFARTNAGNYGQVGQEAHAYLAELFAPHDEKLRNMTGRCWSWMEPTTAF